MLCCLLSVRVSFYTSSLLWELLLSQGRSRAHYYAGRRAIIGQEKRGVFLWSE